MRHKNEVIQLDFFRYKFSWHKLGEGKVAERDVF